MQPGVSYSHKGQRQNMFELWVAFHSVPPECPRQSRCRDWFPLYVHQQLCQNGYCANFRCFSTMISEMHSYFPPLIFTLSSCFKCLHDSKVYTHLLLHILPHTLFWPHQTFFAWQVVFQVQHMHAHQMDLFQLSLGSHPQTLPPIFSSCWDWIHVGTWCDWCGFDTEIYKCNPFMEECNSDCWIGKDRGVAL